ncbi:Pentatricopeptide repeat-containing protein [Quillaja saponaria]|uniref:Pentatricopeptide repeat-containing protein n=1 Tax=Quillaja saponaria TaxID=32244 RepID=A0AAD7LEH6_QUISA|nr:Pentatricopeptide repeat-containing protein [Quillaja saponaria]
MISRQASFKSLYEIPQQRLTGYKIFASFKHEHYLLDQIPQPTLASVNLSMYNCLQKNLPFQALGIFKKQLQLGFAENIDEVTVAQAFKACRGFEESEDALHFALRMNLNGVVFDPVSYTTALSFCSDDIEFFFGLQLHSHIVKNGFDCENFVGNALITMYSRWGRLVEARRVFDKMPIRDLVSCNAMISGYTQEGDCGLEAVLVFSNMVREGMMLDHVSFTSALSACSQERNVELGKQIHALTIKTGHDAHVSVGNILISAYVKFEVVQDAKLVFQIMSDRNVVSWTTMICVNEEDAVSLFSAMRMQGVYPNDVTFIGLIHAITIRSMVKEGHMVHGFCIKTSFLSETNVCNSLITMYAKFASMQESRRIFEELRCRETISWNALISGYAQNGLHQEALLTFLSAIIETKPNQYTFGSVLSAIGSAEDLSLKYGQQCHSNLLKLGLNTDPIVAAALLDMYAKRGNISESQKVFHETPKRSQFAWTSMISAYAQHGDYESVMDLFKEMENDGAKPDAITFLSVMTACCRKGMVEVGREFFDSMIKEYSIEPDPEHYSCMVDMLGRAGLLDEAEELAGQIPGGPGLSVLQSLLGSCRIHGNMEMAERAADSLKEMVPMESGSYVVMSNLYAEKGEWEKVAKLRKGMRERGLKKEVGFSWVDVDNGGFMTLYGFSSGDKCHPHSEEICRTVEFLGLEMNFMRDRGRETGREHLDHNFE